MKQLMTAQAYEPCVCIANVHFSSTNYYYMFSVSDFLCLSCLVWYLKPGAHTQRIYAVIVYFSTVRRQLLMHAVESII